MSDPTLPGSTPESEPLPPPHLERVSPRVSGEISPETQRVFDVVTGPNLRLSDNLIQLALIVAGTILSAVAGWLYASGEGAVLGGFAGLVASLLLSGFVIGLVRSIRAFRGR